MSQCEKNIMKKIVVIITVLFSAFGMLVVVGADVEGVQVCDTATLSIAQNESEVSGYMRQTLLSELLKVEWKYKAYGIRLKDCSLESLQALKDIQGICAFVNQKKLYRDDVEEKNSFSIMNAISNLYNNPDLLVNTLLDRCNFGKDERYQYEETDFLLCMANVPSIHQTTRNRIYMLSTSYIVELGDNGQFKLRANRPRSVIIERVMQIMSELGPCDGSFVNVVVNFTYSGYKQEIVRAAITALKKNRERIMVDFLNYFKRDAGKDLQDKLANVVDVMTDAIAISDMQPSRGIFWRLSRPEFYRKNLHETADVRKEWILGLYSDENQAIIKQLFDACGDNIPTFSQWMSSGFAKGLLLGDEPKPAYIRSLVKSIQSFKATVGEESLSLLIDFWGFAYVAGWATIDYYDYSDLFDIIIQTLRESQADSTMMRSYITSIITKCNVNRDNADERTRLFFQLLLAQKIEIRSNFVAAILDEIISNEDARDQLIKFLITALKLRIVEIPESEFLEEKISYLLNTDLQQNYYLIMDLICALPLKNNLFLNREKEIRIAVKDIDEGIYYQNNALFHYLRLKIHRDISKSSLYLLDAVLEGLRGGDGENMIENVLPYVKDIAKKDVEQAIRKSDFAGLGEILRRLYKIYGDEYSLIPMQQCEECIDQITNVPDENKTVIKRLLVVRQGLYAKYNPQVNFSHLDQTMKNTIANILGPSIMEQLSKVSESGDNQGVLSFEALYETSYKIKEIIQSLKEELLKKDEYATVEPVKEAYRNLHQVMDDYNFPLYGDWVEYKERKYDMANTIIFLESIDASLLSVLNDRLVGAQVDWGMPSTGETLPVELKESLQQICSMIDHMELKGLAPTRMCMFRDVLMYNKLTLSQMQDLLSIIKYDSVERFQSFLLNSFGLLPYYIGKSIGCSELSFGYHSLQGATKGSDQYYELVHDNFLSDFLAHETVLNELNVFIEEVFQHLDFIDDTIQYPSLAEETGFIDVDQSRKKRGISAVDFGTKAFNLLYFKEKVPPFYTLTIPVLEQIGADERALRKQTILAILQIEKKSKQRFPFNFASLSVDEKQLVESARGHSIDKQETDLLLVSTRSGSFISLPGALDTILNVGMCDPVVDLLVKSGMSEIFVYHNYYRFLFSFSSAWGKAKERELMALELSKLDSAKKRRVSPEIFKNLSEDEIKAICKQSHDIDVEAILSLVKRIKIYEQLKSLHEIAHEVSSVGDNLDSLSEELQEKLTKLNTVSGVNDLTVWELKDLCQSVKNLTNMQIILQGRDDYPDYNDPVDLLIKSITAIHRSWQDKNAIKYREDNHVSNRWRTSVTLQKMVQGNLNPQSYTAIATLQNKRPTGEIVFNNGGEAIASGTAARGISLAQAKIEFPRVYKDIVSLLFELQEREAGHNVYVEVTGEYDVSNDTYALYLLQERVMSRIKEGPTEKYVPNPQKNRDVPITQGKGVYGGVSWGVFINGVGLSADEVIREAQKIRVELDKDSSKKRVGIFVLFNAFLPSDGLKLLTPEITGCLTTNIGGSTHAAFVAGRKGKLIVSQVEGLRMKQDKETYTKEWLINDEPLRLGKDVFTVVGYPDHEVGYPPYRCEYSGNIYKGMIPLKKRKELRPLQLLKKTNKTNTTLILSAA